MNGDSPKKYAVIVAGGSGSRMQSEVPKQFLLLNNYPIILHTLNQFLAFDSTIQLIVVLHPLYRNLFEEMLVQHGFTSIINIVDGGETRFHSVKNGLALIADKNALVAIHDAARPLVSEPTISRTFEMAALKGNAIPVVEMSDSIRRLENGRNSSVSRANFRIVQTPQCFNVELIQKAFELPYTSEFTDDATVLEKNGHLIQLVEGNVENIKITRPSDLIVAEALLKKNNYHA